MKPITLLSLMVAAIALSLAVRQITLSGGGVENRRHVAGTSRKTPDLSNQADTREEVGSRYSRTSARPTAQSLSESNRIIAELVVAGFSPEDAAESYRLMNEMASQARNTRPPMPGTRTAIDTNKWPLFED